MNRLRLNRDIVAGLMFVAWGAAGLVIGRDYPVGTALRMGPGYVPRLLCWGLVLTGLALAAKGAFAGGEALARWHLRPLVLVSAAILAFAALIVPAGLVPAALAVVVMGALAGPEFRLGEVAALAIVLAAAATALFVHALKLPLNVWPS
jgi:Tripartite tricarboxylate transporter TctB family